MARSGYDMYFDKCLFPVTPEKISIKINGNNKTVNLREIAVDKLSDSHMLFCRLEDQHDRSGKLLTDL